MPTTPHAAADPFDELMHELEQLVPQLPQPPVVKSLLVIVSSIVGLFLTQGLIDNETAKAVTGDAAILLPMAVLGFMAVRHVMAVAAHARVTAAVVAAKANSVKLSQALSVAGTVKRSRRVTP